MSFAPGRPRQPDPRKHNGPFIAHPPVRLPAGSPGGPATPTNDPAQPVGRPPVPGEVLPRRISDVSPVSADPNNLGDVQIYAQGESQIDAKIIIEAVNGGNLGTMDFKVSFDRGASWKGRHPLASVEHPPTGGDYGWFDFFSGIRAPSYTTTRLMWADSNGDGFRDRIIWIQNVSTSYIKIAYCNIASSLWEFCVGPDDYQYYTLPYPASRMALLYPENSYRLPGSRYKTYLKSVQYRNTIYIYYIRYTDDVPVMRSSTDGVTWTPEVKTSDLSYGSGNERMTVFPDGTIAIYYATTTSVYVRLSTDGITFGSAILVWTKAALESGTINAKRITPVHNCSSSRIIVMITSQHSVNWKQFIAYFLQSTDGGATWSAMSESPPSTTNSDMTFSDAEMDQNGTIHVMTWRWDQDEEADESIWPCYTNLRPGDADFLDPPVDLSIDGIYFSGSPSAENGDWGAEIAEPKNGIGYVHGQVLVNEDGSVSYIYGNARVATYQHWEPYVS